MGLYARNPVLVAPGMGMNALFAFVMVHGGKMPWQTALGCVFWSGVIFAVLAAFNARKLVVDAIPANLRHAVSCGIGLFISLIGLVNAKFVVGDPVTIVHSASLNPVVITFLIGLAVTTILVARRVTGALMLGIVFTTLIAIPIGRFWGDGTAYWPAAIATKTLVNWNGLFSAPDFSGIGQLDLARRAEGDLLAVHLRDAVHVVLRCALHLHGDLGGRQALRQRRQPAQHPPVDDRRFVLRARFRAARHEPGERVHRIGRGHFGGRAHGLVAVVAGLCFLPFLFLSPLLSLVPAIATAPALVLVGVFMMESITQIEWQRFDEAIPAFLAMILIPLRIRSPTASRTVFSRSS